jgi:hypothetical protein
MKSLHYLFIIFLVGTIAFPLQAQQNLSLQDALTIALSSNAELKSTSVEIKKAEQQKVIARSLFLPSVNAGALANHYFQLPAFFGFGNNSEGNKIPYGRFGGKDQLTAFFCSTAVV